MLARALQGIARLDGIIRASGSPSYAMHRKPALLRQCLICFGVRRIETVHEQLAIRYDSDPTTLTRERLDPHRWRLVEGELKATEWEPLHTLLLQHLLATTHAALSACPALHSLVALL